MSIPVRVPIASVVVIRRVGEECEVLLMRRTAEPVGAWCQVAGKIEPGETAWQTGLREMAEETGLTPQNYWSADFMEQFYKPARDCITFAPVFVAQVATEATPVLNAEHDAYRWLSFAEAGALVSFGGQREMLGWVAREFVERAPSEHLRIPL